MRLATTATALGLACLATNAAAHPVTLHMAFISEADDGLTRQNVDALGHSETLHERRPPSDQLDAEEAASSSEEHHVVTHHPRRHHRHASSHAAVAAAPAPTPKQRPWLMVKIVAFTHWWNGWSERNLHTTALDVHLDRPAPPDKKTA